MFVDEAQIEVLAGRGGDGMVSFRKEKYINRGGPNGGDGGKGGDIVVVATHNANTLHDFRHKRRIKAASGRPGGTNNSTGANGDDVLIEVPVGTIITDADSGEVLADLTQDGQRVVVARGGDGGKGNSRFKSSTNRAPRRATPGFPGEERVLTLELKLIADIGLVGFPSVGKSTIIAAISSARPKIGAYPFTTLAPNLGVIDWKNGEPFVVADIPGLIEGAHEGLGLGTQFLKHVERTNLIVHVLEVTPSIEGVQPDRDPIKDFEVILGELEKFNPALLESPQMVVLNKCDLPFVAARIDELKTYFEVEQRLPFLPISAATGHHLDELKDRFQQAVDRGEFRAEKQPWE